MHRPATRAAGGFAAGASVAIGGRMWCGARGRVPGAGSLAGVVPTPSTWHGLLRTHSMSRPRLPDGASDRAAACALSVHAGEPARALHSSCPSRPARALVSPAAARDRCFPAASRKPGHAGSSWSGGGPAGLASRAQTLLLRQACQMRLLSVMAQESANQAAAALSTASTTAKVFNDGLDPMARTVPPPPPCLLMPAVSLRRGFAWCRGHGFGSGAASLWRARSCAYGCLLVVVT